MTAAVLEKGLAAHGAWKVTRSAACPTASGSLALGKAVLSRPLWSLFLRCSRPGH